MCTECLHASHLKRWRPPLAKLGDIAESVATIDIDRASTFVSVQSIGVPSIDWYHSSMIPVDVVPRVSAGRLVIGI